MFDGVFEMVFLRGDGVAGHNGSESAYLVVPALQFFLLDFQDDMFFPCCIFGVDFRGLGVGYKLLDRFEVINQFQQFLPVNFPLFLKILNNFPFFFNQINFIFMTASQSAIQIFNHVIKGMFIFLVWLQFQVGNFEVMGFLIEEIGELLGFSLKGGELKRLILSGGIEEINLVFFSSDDFIQFGYFAFLWEGVADILGVFEGVLRDDVFKSGHQVLEVFDLSL